jgi:uncharacterized protein YndB with AHSA1/START domain
MKLQTIFNKDIANKRMHITREFAAPIADVWQAWTDSKLLDQWWAPKPWKAQTKSMNFREGGHWLYSMVGPDGSRHWAKMDFLKIVKHDHFTSIDGFADENGNATHEFPSMDWTSRFYSSPNGTRVEVEVKFKTEADLLKIAELGFQEGFTAAHGNLDELFALQKVY